MPAVCATDARSFQSASRTVGTSSSAMATRASPATGGLPAALEEAFCASMAWRTAWIPPRRSCSATGICSGRRAASMALRCTVEVAMAGRSPRAGRPSPSPGRRLPGRRGPLPPRGRSPRSSRGPRSPVSAPRRPPRRSRCSPSSSRRRFCDPGARITDTSGARRGVPLTSMRPSTFSGERPGFAAVSERISIPSSPTSTSACSTAPTVSPAGTSAPSTLPLGCLAPAARQVHVPSGRWLVNSMSIRRDMRRTRYLAGARWPRCRVPTGIP